MMLKTLVAMKVIGIIVSGIMAGVTIEVTTNGKTETIKPITEEVNVNKEIYEEKIIVEEKVEEKEEITDEVISKDEIIEMTQTEEKEEPIEEIEDKNEEEYEEEEDIYTDKFTDEEIRSAYYNIPSFKEKFMKLQDEHETLAYIPTSNPKCNDEEWEYYVKENIGDLTLEDVEKIQVQGNVLQRYKEAIIYDCRVGYVSTVSDATLMGEQIWRVICDIEIPDSVVNE